MNGLGDAMYERPACLNDGHWLYLPSGIFIDRDRRLSAFLTMRGEWIVRLLSRKAFARKRGG